MRLSADDPTLRQMVNEYCEMPGLCLTPRQAGHLWQLSPERAARLLDDLVDLRFLIRTDQGAYARRVVAATDATAAPLTGSSAAPAAVNDTPAARPLLGV